MDKLFIGYMPTTFPTTVLDGHELQLEVLESYFQTVKRCLDADDYESAYEAIRAALETIETFRLYAQKELHNELIR